MTLAKEEAKAVQPRTAWKEGEEETCQPLRHKMDKTPIKVKITPVEDESKMGIDHYVSLSLGKNGCIASQSSFLFTHL